jgi:hypothetical protein
LVVGIWETQNQSKAGSALGLWLLAVGKGENQKQTKIGFWLLAKAKTQK